MDFFKCCYPQKENVTVKNKDVFFPPSNNQNDSHNALDDEVYKSKLAKSKNYQEDMTSEFDKESPIFSNQTADKDKLVSKNFKNDKSNQNLQNNSNVNKQFVSFPHSLTFNEHEVVPSHSSSNNISIQTNQNHLKSSKNDHDDTSFLDFQNRIITEDEAKKAPKLLIEEIEGDIFNNNKLVINAMGLVNGQRKAKDGIVFFGPNLTKGDTIINDYVLNLENNHGNNDTTLLHTFIIYYRKDLNKYFIRTYKEKDSQTNQIVLIKLDNSHQIKKKAIVKIADMYFQLFTSNQSIDIVKLEAKSKEKDLEEKKMTFTAEESPITIGRNKKCKIPYPEEKSFSRIQTTIQYVNNRWEIKDGSDKPSTNGTWLYAQNSYEIQNGTCFRVFSSVLRITIEENNSSYFLGNK